MDAVPTRILPPARSVPLKHTQTSAFPDAFQEDILYCAYRFHYLLLSQLAQLLGIRHTSRDWLRREKIKPLVKAGLLYEQYLSRKSRAGSLPIVYSLATKGRHHMESLGYTLSTHQTPSEQVKSAWYLTHVLELNGVLISAHLLTRSVSGIHLLEWKHDLDMQHHKTRLADLNGKKRYIVPDGFLDFETKDRSGTRRVSFVIELDRGTMNGLPFKQRISNYCDFLSEPYKRDFGSDSCTILWITTSGSRRVQQLRQWTNAELENTQKEEYKVYHRFLAIPALFTGCVLPSALFFAPVWKTLRDETPISLLRRNP